MGPKQKETPARIHGTLELVQPFHRDLGAELIGSEPLQSDGIEGDPPEVARDLHRQILPLGGGHLGKGEPEIEVDDRPAAA